MVKKALVFLADGFEEVEAITPIDYLQRAGITVTTAAVSGGEMVKGAHHVGILADTTLEKLSVSAADWDAVVLPGGGKGSENLAASEGVSRFVTAMAEADKLVCAICAAPALVLAPLGLLKGRTWTCYPGMEEKTLGTWTAERVAVDGNIITSRGAGTAGEFAAAIIGKLAGRTAAEQLARSVLL
ncbi:DJ-1 family protein [Spirochaetia bacterium]|nr:DJ-1 family protein [Spirochaetia bacterium]